MLYIVGIGCGSAEGMTGEARDAIERSSLIVGYTVYNELLRPVFPDKKYHETGMRQEKERVIFALEQAACGLDVSLVCSGDAGVYGMACLAYELAENYRDVQIKAVPGVTAALSGAALLGSPLTNDFAVISLSDLLTPWEIIEKRVEGAAIGDLAIAIYNPMSHKRTENLRKACDIILKYRDADTPCGIATNIGREGENCRILTLGELKDSVVDMFTTVFIGSSATRIINGKLVTPRGYRL
ncbi:MAG: precorrin-3B C(17)-methyltransferase [Oscillospiraceae bacterium]|nr:precorrin-3B C(17)-methyltransferase [Oscillospiraceae bacterium]